MTPPANTARSACPTAVVVGYGSIGRRHARSLAAIGCPLVIVNRRESVRAQAALDYPGALVAEDCAALDTAGFAWQSCVAVIATWGPSHADLFHLLADRGVKRILCEKPMASSVALAAAMAERAEAEGIALGLNHTLRYAGLAEAVAACARKYELGEPCGMAMTGGASCLVTNGVHWIDFAAELFGAQPRFVSSTARGEAINPRSPGLMLYGGTATWVFEGGPEAMLSLSNRSSVFPEIQVYFRDAMIRLGYIVGEHDENIGATVLRRDKAAVQRFPAVTRTGRPAEVLSDGALPGAGGFNAGLHAAGMELIAGDMRSAPPSVGVSSVSACIGALLAGREGKTIDLPICPQSAAGREQWPIS